MSGCHRVPLRDRLLRPIDDPLDGVGNRRPAPLLELLPEVLALGLGQEDGHELVAALADLAAHVGEGHLLPELGEGALPGLGVHVDGVDQGAVDVEEDRSEHERSLGARNPDSK